MGNIQNETERAARAMHATHRAGAVEQNKKPNAYAQYVPPEHWEALEAEARDWYIRQAEAVLATVVSDPSLRGVITELESQSESLKASLEGNLALLRKMHAEIIEAVGINPKADWNNTVAAVKARVVRSETLSKINAKIGADDQSTGSQAMAYLNMVRQVVEVLGLPSMSYGAVVNLLVHRVEHLTKGAGILRRLVSTLPECGVCSEVAERRHGYVIHRATRSFGRGGPRYCDKHGDGVEPYPRQMQIVEAEKWIEEGDA